MESASAEQQQAQNNFAQREPAAWRWVAPGSYHPLREVEPDHQADPSIGVHLVLQQSSQGQAQRQCLERQPGAIRAQRRQPQLPGKGEENQSQEAASGKPARGTHG
jgi:hypothetical protein